MVSLLEFLEKNPSLRDEYELMVYNPAYEDDTTYSERAGLTNSGNKDSDRRSKAFDIFEFGFELGLRAAGGPGKMTEAEKILLKPKRKR